MGSRFDCLRYVPVPWETMFLGEGPAAWIRGKAIGAREEMPSASLVLPNRERELGLDRRETG